MKLLLLALVYSPGVFAQATITITVPGEANTSATFSAEQVSSTAAYVKAIGGPPSTTLTVASLTTDTKFTVASTAGVQVGMGVLLSGEVSLVTAVSGQSLTVTRARVGTTVVASPINTTVDYLACGSYGCYIKHVLAASAQSTIALYPGPAITAAQTAITAQQAIIAAALAAAVQ